MNDYTYLTPEEKIEKYIKERNSKVTIHKWLWYVIFAFVLTAIIVGSFIDFQSYGTETAIVVVLIHLFFIFIFSNMKHKIRRKEYELYMKLKGETPRPERLEDPFNTSFDSIRIINAKFKKLDKRGFIFGGEKEILIENYISRPYEIFLEATPQKGEQCFILCLENFENPIAIFKGYYNGKKYLTWDCK